MSGFLGGDLLDELYDAEWRGVPFHMRPLSVDALLRTYRQDVDKKRMIVRDATNTRGMLLFVVEALRALRADDGFVNLLRAEGLYTMPAKLAERVGPAPGEA